jgi:hypothetical protein
MSKKKGPADLAIVSPDGKTGKKPSHTSRLVEYINPNQKGRDSRHFVGQSLFSRFVDPTPAPPGSPTEVNGYLLDEQELAWAKEKDPNKLSPPKLVYYFTTRVNPKTNQTYLVSAQAAVRVLKKACKVRCCSVLYEHRKLYKCGQWGKYDRTNLAAVIAIVCFKAFYGYDMKPPITKFSLQAYRQHLQNSKELIDFENTVMRLVKYVLKWINKNDELKEDDIVNNEIVTSENRIKGKVRCSHGMFSNKYIQSKVPNISNDMKAVVKGHLYDWCLVFDLCMPQFREKVLKGKKYLTTSERVAMFSENYGEELYPAL